MRATGIVATLACCLLCRPAAAAPSLVTLFDFAGGSGGASPSGALVADTSGALYGTTQSGGACASDATGCGTVFVLPPPSAAGGASTATVLHDFAGLPDDGAFPESTLVFDAAGNLYGVTDAGGGGGCTAGGVTIGCGTVFELTPPARRGRAWHETVLYSFTGTGDGLLSGPNARAPDVILDAAGTLYGAANSGGAEGCGTIYQLTPPAAPHGAWSFSLLWVFAGDGRDGCLPVGGLIFGAAGELYGMTSNGGAFGNGAVFRLTPPAHPNDAWTEAVIYSLPAAGSGGSNPVGRLAVDAAGLLYGQTIAGGSGGAGIVFRLLPPKRRRGAWRATVLHDFAGGRDGSQPQGVVVDGSGTVFGTTAFGGDGGCPGPGGCGTVFELVPPPAATRWREKILWRFSVGDGSVPVAAPLLGAGGILLGTTQAGGSGCSLPGCGTVFALQP